MHQGLCNSIKDELGEDRASLIMLAIRINNCLQERMRQRFFDTTPVSWFPEPPKPRNPSIECAGAHLLKEKQQAEVNII